VPWEYLVLFLYKFYAPLNPVLSTAGKYVPVVISLKISGVFGWGSNSVSRTSLLADPIWLRKITTDFHILADVNIECSNDRYPKLKIDI
jgi:hypothetical protein